MNTNSAKMLVFTALLLLSSGAGGQELSVYVHQTTPGCCKQWIKSLQDDAGFSVNVLPTRNLQIHRNRLSVPANLASCHVGTVGGYVVEGHVPAQDIRRLFSERPAALGLAVPAMPGGSPGMESEPPVSFDVLLVDKDGKTSLFKHYP